MIKSIKYTATTPVIIEAINLYKSGVAIKPICKQLHIDGTTLRNILIQEELLRTRADAIRRGKGITIMNDDAFDVLTPDALYWIGFLYADGHIEKKPRTRITVTLSDKDRTQLEKLNQFMGGGLNILDVTYKDQAKATKNLRGMKNFDSSFLRLSFSSGKIYQKLKSLGFTHNKTLSLVPDAFLKNSRDFWRGVVDGDGWVCWSGDKRKDGKYDYGMIGLSGTEDTIKGFMEFIRFSGIDSNVTPKKDKRGNVWKVSINMHNAQKIGHLLYKDSVTYLDRKYNKYLEITNEEQKFNSQ